MLNSIAVIGGSDGPTAIFTATSPDAGWPLIVLILLLAAGVLFVILRRKKK